MRKTPAVLLVCAHVFVTVGALGAAIDPSAPTAAAKPPSVKEDLGLVPLPPGVTRDDVVRLQIFLDEQNFGPGKIDGQFGGFTRKSWLRYQESQGMKPVDRFNAHTTPLTNIDPIYVTYTITPEDVTAIGVVPSQLALQAKNKVLPYTSLSELLGERFHIGVNFLKRLNAPHDIDQLPVGGTVTVPNVVPPFDLNQVLALRQDTVDREKARKAATGVAAAGGGETTPAPPVGTFPTPVAGAMPGAAAASRPADPAIAPVAPDLPTPAPDLSGRPVLPAAPAESNRLILHVNTNASYLEIRDGSKLVACFPITPGSDEIPTPKGEWHVLAKTLLPEFRWDEAMLKHGVRSNNFYQLPPGPNNPVGIAWIALNRPGIGIHGTSDPDSIGRSASHGCIRLSNWDAFKVYGMVTKGTKVIIE